MAAKKSRKSTPTAAENSQAPEAAPSTNGVVPAESRDEPATNEKHAEAATEPASKKRGRAGKSKAPGDAGSKPLKAGRTSALDAAARVLAEAGHPMSCPEMIRVMAEKGYWTSPGGLTPAATLYSALLREVHSKGPLSRFVKTERGKFGRTEAI